MARNRDRDPDRAAQYGLADTDRTADRQRNQLKRYWRVVTCDEKRAATSLAMMTIAACLTWL